MRIAQRRGHVRATTRDASLSAEHRYSHRLLTCPITESRVCSPRSSNTSPPRLVRQLRPGELGGPCRRSHLAASERSRRPRGGRQAPPSHAAGAVSLRKPHAVRDLHDFSIRSPTPRAQVIRTPIPRPFHHGPPSEPSGSGDEVVAGGLVGDRHGRRPAEVVALEVCCELPQGSAYRGGLTASRTLFLPLRSHSRDSNHGQDPSRACPPRQA